MNYYIGLGIGVDYGQVSIINNEIELTVVGVPVVYACRLSAAPAGTTVLNGSAFDNLAYKFGKIISYQEVSIDLKHEGSATVFMVELMQEVIDIAEIPKWAKAES